MRNQTLALGLGSNLDNPLENLRLALSEIKKSQFFEVTAVSSIYESDAQLPSNAVSDWNKPFLNAAVLVRVAANESPENILCEIQKIEKKIGRIPAERWAPRLIDIDLLFWDQEDFVSEALQIPHKDLSNRPFALLPLLEIWRSPKLILPDWSHSWSENKPFNTKKSLRYFWPRLVGILNVTKDSFSDGGMYLSPDTLHKRVSLLLEQGAEIIDIGAESTRPGAETVSEAAEFSSLDWALRELKLSCSISLDCRHAGVAARILEKHKVNFLNDVDGFADTGMKELLKISKLSGFVMHSLGVPPALDRVLDKTLDPCKQLTEWWKQHRLSLLEFGIEDGQIIFDPGIGFGKTKQQNLFILQNLNLLSEIQNSIMIGHSRKSFLTLLSDRPAEMRDLETALVTRGLNLAYVQYLRVHDVQTQLAALR